MAEPIKVGDLVAIVRSCCVEYRDGVSLFTVAEVYTPKWISASCKYCRATLPKNDHATPEVLDIGVPLSWLRRIPPPAELGIVNEREEITA